MMTPRAQLPNNPDVPASNEKMLRRLFPKLASLVDSYDGRWSASVHVHATRSGLPTITVENGPTMVHVHSSFQPVVEAERWVREPLGREWDFAVVFGMGLGYHLDALLERRPLCRIVVIEPRPDVFCAAMALKPQNRLLSHPHLELIVTEDPVEAARELFRGHLQRLMDNAPLFVWPATASYAADYWKKFESQLVDMLRATRTDVVTRRLFHIQWLNNFFENVGRAVGDPGVAALGDRLAGRPAIIAGAGPSLEKNVHLLREAKGNVVIIAAGSSINPLLRHGVEPDLLVSYDPHEANYRHFEHLSAPNVPLVYVPTIYPRIVEEYQGPRFVAAMDTFPFIQWLFHQLGDEKGLLSSGPSVANVSWHLAHVLGLNPIVLVGQDLAFTDGKTHAAGAAHARTVALESGDGRVQYITTEGIDGSTVFTNSPMYSMKVWFEQRLVNASDGTMTIDATEGGARISGTTIMTLKEALETYCRESFNPYDTIMSVHRAQKERLRDGGVEQRLHDIFIDLREQTRAVGRLMNVALRDAERLLQDSTTKRLTEQRLAEAVARLGRHVRGLAAETIFKVFIEPATVHVLRAIAWLMETRLGKDTDLYGKGAEIARQYIVLFTSARDIARHVGRLLEAQTK